MNIFEELNKKIKVKLLINREPQVPYNVYLNDLFEYYKTLIAKIDDDFALKYLPESTSMSDVNKKICDNIDSLLKAYQEYSEGKLSTAIEFMRTLFSENYEETLLRFLELDDTTNWYRIRRLTKNDRQFCAKEMFHIPFDKRNEVVNYRYSISGYPCLYLGKTILSCWEETGRPALDDIVVSRLSIQPDKRIKVLDLRFPTKKELDELSEETKPKNFALLVTWPLIIACSIKTITPDASFKYEYVHPQLLMLVLLENTNYAGVAYTSTHIDVNMSQNEDDYSNVALPVRKIKDKGLCGFLSEQFRLTRGVPFMEMDIKNIFAESPKVDKIALILPRSKTKFKRAEEWLNNVELESIN